MTPGQALRSVTPSRMHRLADDVFLRTVAQCGLPGTDEDTLALAKDCYKAAQIMIAEGRRAEGAVFGAKSGGSRGALNE